MPTIDRKKNRINLFIECFYVFLLSNATIKLYNFFQEYSGVLCNFVSYYKNFSDQDPESIQEQNRWLMGGLPSVLY